MIYTVSGNLETDQKNSRKQIKFPAVWLSIWEGYILLTVKSFAKQPVSSLRVCLGVGIRIHGVLTLIENSCANVVSDHRLQRQRYCLSSLPLFTICVTVRIIDHGSVCLSAVKWAQEHLAHSNLVKIEVIKHSTQQACCK